MGEALHEYFLEILTEEIPAWMHDNAHLALRQKLEPLVSDLGGDVSLITVSSTPRRLVVFLPRLSERTKDREQEIKGPPRKNAFDSNGKPTAALTGFLRKNNAAIEDLMESGDEYIRIRRSIPGRSAAELIAERVPAAIEAMRWPKMMRWGTGEYSYIRPIHSLVSLLDDQHLPVQVFGVPSGTATVGHRTLSPNPIEVRSYNDYVSKLELAHVVVDSTRRRHVMAERARILANQVNGSPSIDATIWSQWQYLTEYPGVVRAEFRSDFLALPEEVLVTVMRVHQKQLPIRDASGGLTNFFLAVLDNVGDPDGNAAYGNAFVTNARFADAEFFYTTDRKRPLEDRLQQLSHLQFQEKVGDYQQKTKRIEAIATGICQHL
ncbi:MAG TPA: glycine--tRNA ligase subunit beta, partial [Thermoanaerobaculia bacterium]|nr:glycine--tRNA ligase subunit beta [Thermoanaerobaculia bacterium]